MNTYKEMYEEEHQYYDQQNLNKHSRNKEKV